jgi:hypothetical protein
MMEAAEAAEEPNEEIAALDWINLGDPWSSREPSNHN